MSLLDRAIDFRKEFEVSRKVAQKYVKATDLTAEEMLELIDVYDKWQEGIALKIGDKVSYNGELFEVIQSHTTQADWLPNTTPALYKKITPATTGDGEEIIPEFKQPTGAHDSYKKGDKVLFEGKIYESLIDNNSYSPKDYPQGWKEITE